MLGKNYLSFLDSTLNYEWTSGIFVHCEISCADHNVFCVFADKPKYVLTSIQSKLLSLTGHAALELKAPVKPAAYDIWMANFKDVSNALIPSFDPEQAGQNVWSDLDPICLIL